MRQLFMLLLLVLLAAPTFAENTAASADVEARVTKLINQLTLNEKLKLLSGVRGRFIPAIERLGLPELKMSDGPVGAHNDGPDTAYPSAIALAATWNNDLARRFGQSIGSDAQARGDHFLLAPAMNIYRVPVDGRNSEYLGEDPYLSGTIASQIVRGIQSQGVVATVKHYAGNEQEDHRGTISDEVDERTLREIYMRQFEITVRNAHPWAVMAAYNKINGVYCTANKWLLTDVLKNEWGFAGLVMSDWGATHDTLGPANAGLDVEMPGGEQFIPAKLLPLIQSDSISQATIDAKVRRILRVVVAMGFLDHSQKDSSIPLDNPHSAQTALEIARQGTVLLKNQGNFLPLDRGRIKTLAIIGPNADPAVTGAGGSSFTDPFHATSVLAGIKALAGKSVNIIYIPMNSAKKPATTRPLLDPAQETQLASADAVIICAGFNPSLESEGFDRTYALPSEQNQLIQTASRINPHCILIINAGGNVDMNPWIKNIPALVQAWYPGQEGGTAIAEILFGDICPSGRLPATFEKQWKDTPAFGNYPGANDKVAYKEGIFVGYRYFDAKGIEPRFPFGFGLSYTSFEFSHLEIKPASPDDQQFSASVEVTNTGKRDGSEVAQFYVGQDNPSLPRPPRWLAGFAKVSLHPGESKTCSVHLDSSSLCYWDTASHHWKVDPGSYHVWAGDSSRSLPLNGELQYR